MGSMQSVGSVKRNAVVIGLDSAGKTTVLSTCMPASTPHLLSSTVGLSTCDFQKHGVSWHVWDMSGAGRYRQIWPAYFRHAHAIVIVVDAVDIKRIGIVRDEVRRVIEHPDVRGPGQPILVLLNKMDVTVDDESEKLTVPLVQKLVAYETVRADHVVKVQPCSALNGTGVDEGFRWLAQQLTARLH